LGLTPDPDDPGGKKGVRPLPLTVFCALGFMSFPLFISQYRSPIEREMQFAINGREHFHWFFVLLLAMMAAYLGLWLMRRWGYYAFTLVALAMGVHMFIGAKNMEAFRHQLTMEAAGTPVPKSEARDTSFLTDPEFLKICRENGIDKPREIISDAPASQSWMIFAFKNLQSFFVWLVAFLVRDRMR